MVSPGPPPERTIADVQEFFSRTDQPSTPVFTEEVAESLEWPPQTVRHCLEALAERGEIQTKQGGDSSRIWWKAEENANDPHQDEAQFSALVSAVKDYAIFMLDPEGSVVTWNEGAEQIKGYSEAEITGEHFSTFYTEDDIADEVPDRNLETAATAGRVEDEGWRVRKDGSRFWANVTITAIRDSEGTLRGFTKVTRDMTERREYEQQLEEQAERLEQQRDDFKRELDDVFERIDDAFYALDDEFQFEYVNERAEAFFATSERELLGRKPWEVLDVDESDSLFEKFETTMVTQEPMSFERYSDPLGIWAMVRVYPSESGLSVYFRDITERKERERELELTRELLEKAERIADVGGWEIDTDTREVFWTDHLFEILAIPDGDEPPLDEALDVYHEEDRSIIEHAVEEALDSGESFDVEVRFRTPDGEVRWLHVKGDPDVDDGEVVLLRGAVQDITERKEREWELQRIRDRMEFALNATDSVVWDWDVDDDEASFYPSAESLYGTTVETWEEFVDVIHPDDRQRAQQGIEKALETGEPKHEEIRIIRNGNVRWIEAPGYPVQDDDGSTRVVGVARDITERKTYDRKLQESNERLEQFAYAVSHDLQEPLRMVSSYLQLIENRYADELDEDGEEFIEFAVDGADRMRSMIQDLLEYSRIQTEGDAFEPVELDGILEDVLADLQFQIEEHDADVTIADLPEVEGDASQLHQLFQNLLDNAIEYSGDEPPRVHVSATRDGDEWVVSVCDEGIGIDPEDQDRIFEVFQRLHTQEEYAGTGIGLALCKRIVERHGGDIWVDSALGEGATFSLSIPVPDTTG
ncbi:PAS domain-containing sensor histidine kinase [Natronosalvus halobius]|uniref:PAS domain-containing sensor histidine kinase n=1 Tax=Natronosalvus halobius TaxID=2953746 RepID=UPI00209DDA47|nr:PAS domain S-box protein [Natronosalvus halobius]USZ71821.1 PAS domain S-box protein [Natronosalvus halobius]